MKQKNKITVGLVGNPNTGKTSLLNALTGLNLHIGNWPGKTVEKKQGVVSWQNHQITVIDLPGTYSITPYSEEEKIAHDFIIDANPGIIVQTIDVNTLERNLLMTFELLAMRKNLILAFNFNKEAKKRGLKINHEKIQEILHIPIVLVEANTGENKENLLNQIVASAKQKPQTPPYLSDLVKTGQEISHGQSMEFIRNKILPFYQRTKKINRTEKIDSWLLNKYLAFPFFLLIIFLMFKTTFFVATPLINIINQFFTWLSKIIIALNLPEFLTSFLIKGVISGVGSVLAFTPLIFILFFIIAILEDTGYLTRIVVLVDRIFHRFGITGRAFIPMILGFGCNVPAIMAARTIRNTKERLIVIFSNSFISCGARLPVYILFAGIFFPAHATLVIMLLYFAGITMALLVSFVLSRLIKDTEASALILELPPYRLPTFRNVAKQAWHQTGLFIKKAGTIILIAVIIIWLLASLPAGTAYGSEESIIGKIGQSLSPLFKPLGFAHWTFTVALIFGLGGKEIIIGTLGTLYDVAEKGLATVIPGLITPLGALTFLVFVLLYIPCLATMAVIKKENGSWKYTLLHALGTIIIAWLAAFVVYRIGLWLGFS
jgi:ferrous iron transport protein B